MDLCITIRTMIKKGKDVYLQAGAGIVADSNPKKEYEECCNKVMAIQHKEYPVVGLQFHPESICTEHGKRMIENFIVGTHEGKVRGAA